MIKRINEAYVRLYFRIRSWIHVKFGEYETAHYVLQSIFYTLFMKKIWYDRTIDPYDYNRIGNYKSILSDFKKIDDRIARKVMINGSQTDIRENYHISFVVQKKKINISGLENSSHDAKEHIFFIKIQNNIIKQNAKIIKELLTLSFFHYLSFDVLKQCMKPYAINGAEIKHFKNIDKQQEKYYMVIKDESCLQKLTNVLDKFAKQKKTKIEKYSKKKFGKVETILNLQTIWVADFSKKQMMFMINKLHFKKYDSQNEIVNIDDLFTSELRK